jgi:hypothetical protein
VLGKAALALYRLPHLFIVLTLDDGRTVRHRFIPAIGRDGFLLSPYIGTTLDLGAMAAGLPWVHRVRSLRIIGPDDGFWSDQVGVTLRPFPLTSQPRAAAAVVSVPENASPAAVAPASADANCTLDLVDDRPADARDGPMAVSGPVLSLLGGAATVTGQAAETVVALTAPGGKPVFYRTHLQQRSDAAFYTLHPERAGKAFAALLDLAGQAGPRTLTPYALVGGKMMPCAEPLPLDLGQ